MGLGKFRRKRKSKLPRTKKYKSPDSGNYVTPPLFPREEETKQSAKLAKPIHIIDQNKRLFK